MTSLFSFLGNGFGAMHTYSKIYSSPEFRDFTDYLNEGTPEEVTIRFFRNMFAQFLDPYVNELLQNNEFNSIFNNNQLTRKEQCKVFAGKVFTKLYDQYADEFKDHLQIDKETSLRLLISTFNDIEHLDRAQNGTDCYTLLLNFYAKKCAEVVKSFYDNAFTNVNEDTMLSGVSSVIGTINSVYEYDSKHINEDLLDSIKDDLSNSDSSGSDSTDENNTANSNNNQNKRPRDTDSSHSSNPPKNIIDLTQDDDNNTPPSKKPRKK